MEDELRESYDIFSSIIDTANEIHLGIEIIQNVDNKEGVIVFANEEVARNTGYSHEELIGMTIHQMLPPEELAKLTERYAKRQAGEEEPTYYEFLAQRKDGTMFPVEIGIGLTTYHGKIASIAFMQDITQRKQAEEQLKEYSENLEQMVEERTRQLEDANKALVRTEKLATIGQLSGSIGHELRNPLGVIKNSAYFLKMKLGHLEDEKVARHLDILDSQIDACNSIISDLLDFSRPGKLEMNEIYIDQVVLEVVQNTTVPQSVEMSTSMAGALAPVMADKGLLERIVSNLVNNSIQAMPDGGKLSLSVNQNNGFVEASVIDTGTGIPEENLDMIFEPLFTTKAKGVGLGLSLTKALVERQNGTISVQSQVGEGTTFTIKFPIAGDNQSVSNT